MTGDEPTNKPDWIVEGNLDTPYGPGALKASITKAPTTTSSPQTPWFQILGQASLLTGLAAAWLLFVGWAYAYAYLYLFGVGISSTSIPLDALAPYGFLVFKAFWILIAVAVVAVVLLVWAAHRFALTFAPALIIGATLISLVAIFVAGYEMAGSKARSDYFALKDNDYPGFRRVEIGVKPEWASPDWLTARAADLVDGCYRLLFVDADHLFVIRPLKDQPEVEPPVLIVPLDEVAAYRIRPEVDSCR